TLAERVDKTLTRLHKHSPKRDEVRDLVAYLEALDPPAPVAAAADRAEAAARGRELFEGRARCARCHTGDRLCDGQRHDVGTGGLFATPSLRGVSRRSQLLHIAAAIAAAQAEPARREPPVPTAAHRPSERAGGHLPPARRGTP